VAIVQDAKGTARGLHVTALKADGSGKALGSKSRRMFGEIRQNAVQLVPIGPDATLAIAEGIETALSYQAITGVPTWAALSADFVAAFEPPPGVKSLIIAADCDANGKGLRAARALGERFKDKMAVRIHGAGESLDWNDRLLGKGAAL
jgi:putative DNA primase/helicase